MGRVTYFFNALWKFMKGVKSNHFNSMFKRLEFILILSYYITLMVIFKKRLIPSDLYTILGQVQAFIALYLAFRYRYLGLGLLISLEIYQTLFLVKELLLKPSVSLFAGLISLFITTILATILAYLSNKQEVQKNELKRLAITDDLTNVYNQRFFKSNMDYEVNRAKRNKRSLGLILIDIDNFKKYNDIYGHDRGDSVLKSTASLIKVAIGNSYTAYRLGGDEFAVVLPDSDQFNTIRVADNIRTEFEAQREFCFGEGIGSQISLSMGISQYPDKASNRDELISQADMALYHSKNLGKNKIHFYQDVISRIRAGISTDHRHLIGVFRALLSTISAKDTYTLGHSERVSNYAVMLGEALNLSLKEICVIQYAGLLHDIGKIEIPKNVLNKTGYLSDEEYEMIKLHPVYSANILESMSDMDQLVDYVKHHHERFDGTGYPCGLAGNQISLGARIICIADSFDAMLSERPYSSSMNVDEALEELRRCAGEHFDPQLVALFVSLMKIKV
ncbi:MAG: diguanylate cyclase [Bacillota bacterium]|nr:diguanylate cyclase [Bacillota bacterium]